MDFIKKVLALLANNIKEVKTTTLGIVTILASIGVLTSNVPAIEANVTEILTAVSVISGVLLGFMASDSKK